MFFINSYWTWEWMVCSKLPYFVFKLHCIIAFQWFVCVYMYTRPHCVLFRQNRERSRNVIKHNLWLDRYLTSFAHILSPFVFRHCQYIPRRHNAGTDVNLSTIVSSTPCWRTPNTGALLSQSSPWVLICMYSAFNFGRSMTLSFEDL